MLLSRWSWPNLQPLFSMFITWNLHEDISFHPLALEIRPEVRRAPAQVKARRGGCFHEINPSSELTCEHLSAKFYYISVECKLTDSLQSIFCESIHAGISELKIVTRQEMEEKDKKGQFLSSSPIPQMDPHLNLFLFYGYCIWDFLQREDKRGMTRSSGCL